MKKITQWMLSASILLAAPALGAKAPKAPKLNASNIDQVVKAMTLQEKADLIVGSRMYYKDENAPAHIKESWKVVPGAAGRINPVPRVGIPAVVLSDGPAGCGVMPMDGNAEYYCTHFPIETLLSSSWDPALIETVGTAIGNEAKEYGVDILLAPAVNIHRHPLCGRNFEYFSEDPWLAGKMAAAYVRGVQSNGIGTSVKHFAANNQETNRMNNNAIVPVRALREIYLRPFEIAVTESQPWTIMTSYNRINGTYSSERKDLIDTVLRGEWGFGGVVMTDWWGGSDAVAQMIAGNDMLEPGTKEQAEQIINGVKSGALPLEAVDKNVTRILRMIVNTPSFKGYKYTNSPDMKSHAELTRRSAQEGMVLLKNNGATLPLKANPNVALFGNVSYNFFSGGTGSGDINRPYVVSLLDGLQNHGVKPDQNLQAIYTAFSKPSQHGEQVRTGEMPLDTAIVKYAADVNDLAIITIGRISGEYVDRPASDFQLSPEEYNMIKNVCNIFHEKGKKVAVVLNVGGVIETASWKDMPDAILLCWQAGQEGGNSVADILTGQTTPSGKLPMTFPISLSDHLSSINFPVDQKIDRKWSKKTGLKHDWKNVDYTVYGEGINVGYRWFDTNGIDVSYPFGYGLSYTTFGYSDAKVESSADGSTHTLTVKITNTGSVPGKEVVELFVEAPKGDIEKPSHELRGFAKTGLLQPGQSEVVTIPVKSADLASFNEALSSWVTDGGEYRFVVSASSRDPRATVPVKVAKMVRKVNDVLH